MARSAALEPQSGSNLPARTRLGCALGMLNLGGALSPCYSPRVLNHALPCHGVGNRADGAAGKSVLQSLQAEENALLTPSVFGEGL